ncbi:lipoprotein [Caldimonas brevitalea]|uniref:Lipoprotein n=1 Tax=Caldimonas brevitalea TaxID=413882 RepID=A0A0G3BFN7_9BURK|nr:lipoprotein [Caldimonas brevitalea]
MFRAAWVLSVATLAGCATSYGPGDLKPGTPAAEVIARMGPPTGEYRQPDGPRRLEFARGPFGRHTYMVDLDAQDRVSRWQQVLDERTFNALPVGISRQEVLYRLGRPSHEMVIPRRNERIWSYRYEAVFCQWFQVSLDRTSDKVTETGYNVDPMCDADSWDGPR